MLPSHIAANRDACPDQPGIDSKRGVNRSAVSIRKRRFDPGTVAGLEWRRRVDAHRPARRVEAKEP
jgi:hypothetical protein